MIVFRVINIWGNSSIAILELIVMGINWINSLLLMIVTLVSSLVLLFSIDYLSIIDSQLFIIYIVLFKLNMILLLLCYDLILFIVMWDLLGLLSYLLINYHCNKVNTGIKAVILNRFGDVVILYLIVYICYYISVLGNSCFILITLLLLILVLFLFILNYSHLFMFSITTLIIMFTKSAQFPFSSWLLGAMNAPAPVSALLHSSTMVLLGIYFAILLSIIIYLLYFFWYLLFNSISLIWSGIKACNVNDIKTLIALSTINQLSYLFIILVHNLLLCVFHIIVHSLFKMNLFLNSNSIIYNSYHYQSIIKIKSFNSFISIIFLISLFLLVISFSKELIVFYCFINTSFSISPSILLLGSFITLIYSLLLYSLLCII